MVDPVYSERDARYVMSLCNRVLPWLGFALFTLTFPAWCKEPAKSEVALKVCVAGISNRTATSLHLERMAERLTRSLVQNKLRAVAMDSMTTDDHELRPTVVNGQEMKSQQCDYVLLTQVRNPRGDLTDPKMPPITIGGRVPSTDASDPMGGQSGPVYRDNLEIDFALFRAGKFDATTNASILEQSSGHVSDSLVQAMDRVANRVAHDLKKK
jgi:hypothetical protein